GASPTPDGGKLYKVGGGQLNVQRVADTDLGTGSISFLTSLNVSAGTLAISGARDTTATTTNKTSLVKSLTITPGATVDLGSNDLLVDWTGGSDQLPTIRGQLVSGRNGG